MMRFTNDEVKNSLPIVLKKLSQALINNKVTNSAGSNSPLLWRGVGGEVKRETSTMPGYAGSSWYFLRYMDPHNNDNFCDRKASDYWNQVDVYIGGTEHAVGHLLYSRMWTKVLYDLGYIGFDEPFKKLVNQGMITGVSLFIAKTTYVSIENIEDKIVLLTTNNAIAFTEEDGVTKKKIKINNKDYQYDSHTEHRIPTNYTNGSSKIYYLDLLKIINDDHFKAIFPDITPENIATKVLWRNDSTGEFIFGRIDDGFSFSAKTEVEKMSKSKYNVTSPDEIIDKYGADTFRMYEMFLGPVEMSKPWDTKGIEGVHRFLRKLWRLFFDDVKGKIWNTDKPTDAELKILHRTIKKIGEDTERFSFNTAVSTFMICVNELADIKCHKKEILEKVLILLTPYAPHIAEELWHQVGNEGSVLDATYPIFDGKYLVESSKEYPVSINGKVRANINLALDLSQEEVEKIILDNELVQKWLEGKPPKRIVFVKGRMVNVVV
ncbi:MAG: class I tRNA ligase family protein [Chitinophagaceae bacterium]|nr:class I tRNA ligase family protein [Chitinophagaceae bacterium]